MIRRKDEAVRMISTETGKPLAQSEREWGLSIDQFRWYAEEARRIYGRIVESRVPGGRFEVLHEPVGIAAAFTAWNFPAALVARKVAPALAAGCATIVRPSSQTPGVAMVMVDCMRAGNLPAGTVNLVVGPTSATYGPIMASPAVRKVSLTGSTRVGQQMIRDAAATVKKVSMELGGNAPLIVYDDADLETALNVAVPTKFANAGQVCVTPDRFFVHERLHDAVRRRLRRPRQGAQARRRPRCRDAGRPADQRRAARRDRGDRCRRDPRRRQGGGRRRSRARTSMRGISTSRRC